MNHEIISQLSIPIENSPTSIAAISDLLAKHKISLKGLFLEQTETNGLFRFTPSNPIIAKSALESQGYTVKLDEVLSISFQDSKGKLAFLTKTLSNSGITIDYIYASINEEGSRSGLILKVSNIHLAIHLLDEILVAA